MFTKNLITQFSKFLTIQTSKNSQNVFQLSKSSIDIQKFSTSSSIKSYNLMEFFDDKKNWTEQTKVKHGREWRIDELRLKSNTDLHKLWYVLHKERNMLLTMEEIYIQNNIPMPSHERIAKVDESMENLLNVVEERNIAFNLLETGETKKSLPYRRYNSFGFIQYYKPKEYYVPWFLNRMWKLKYHYKKIPYWSKYYNSLNRVRLRAERKKIFKKVSYYTYKSIEKNPELQNDKEFVREYFEKKHSYKPPIPYSELIRKPAPNELPKKLKERMRASSKNSQFYDDDF